MQAPNERVSFRTPLRAFEPRFANHKLPACSAIALVSIISVSARFAALAEDIQAFQMNYVTPAYREAALRVLLADANAVANDLHLNEKLPIRETDLIETNIPGVLWTASSGSLGGIATSRYYYIASVGQKINKVGRRFDESQTMNAYMNEIRRKYRAPLADLDTNAAVKLATQWLKAASFDAAAMLRDSALQVDVWTEDDYFVPFYVVQFGDVAQVQLVEPEHTLLDLRVMKPQYMKRRKLGVANSDWLMQQTSDPKRRNMYLTTEDYKEAALEAMLKEISSVCNALEVPEQVPVRRPSIIEYWIETPFFRDRKGLFGTVCTERYAFRFGGSNKLNCVAMNFRPRDDEKEYLASLKLHYTRPISQLNTNGAYTLAAKMLAAFSVDLRLLERDCTPKVKWWDLGQQFVPLYTVEWWSPGDRFSAAASVEVLEPEHRLVRLEVDKPEYIRRGALRLKNRKELLNKHVAQ